MFGKARSKYKKGETIIDSFSDSTSCLRFKGVSDLASFLHNGIVDSSYHNHLFNQKVSLLKMEHLVMFCWVSFCQSFISTRWQKKNCAWIVVQQQWDSLIDHEESMRKVK